MNNIYISVILTIATFNCSLLNHSLCNHTLTSRPQILMIFPIFNMVEKQSLFLSFLMSPSRISSSLSKFAAAAAEDIGEFEVDCCYVEQRLSGCQQYYVICHQPK